MPTETQPAPATKPAPGTAPAVRRMTTRRRLIAASRKLREIGSIASAVASTSHPYMAHIVPMRRCNLACTYCNEFDDVSNPVPIDEMRRRVDHLGRLGTSVITISGGEPLLHPELDDVIRQIRKTGAIAGMITNGYFLMPDRIERLNRAGLDHMQISIDNVMPDDVSKKSLKVLDAKLRMLAEHADFHVNINSVVGGGTANPEDALTISKRALALGFSSTIGIIHDGSGQLKPLGDRERKVWDEVRRLTRRSYSRFNGFQEAIANGEPNDWRCRAGSRYLYVDENGIVSYCSQQRGYPGIPIADYTTALVKKEFLTEKSCAPNCTISCVHQVSYIDHWRAPQHSTVTPGGAGHGEAELVQIQRRDRLKHSNYDRSLDMKHSSNGLLRLIAVFKLLKAALLIAIGIGVLKVAQHGDGILDRWVAALGFDPGGHLVELALSKISSIPPDKLKALGLVGFVYAALFLTEGIGLWLLKRWAEWFTIVITASLIPVEIYEIHHHPTASKIAVLVINIAVLIYLVIRVRNERSATA